MQYEPEIESWMKSFYDSLPPAEQRRYAAVEALKVGENDEDLEYIIGLLGSDAVEVDRARQEFADGLVIAPVAEPEVAVGDDEASSSESAFGEGLGGVAAGFGAAAEGGADSEDDPFGFGTATDTAEEDSSAAAFWQEDNEQAGEDAFSMAPVEEGDAGSEGFGGFGEGGSAEDGAAASAVLETASAGSKQRRTRKGPGPIANILGIVIFGAIGLIAGYGILVAFFPDKDKQMLDVRGRYTAFMSGNEATEPEGTPTDTNRDFVPGQMLREGESITIKAPQKNGTPDPNTPDPNEIVVDDPFGDPIVEPDDTTDPDDEPSVDDPFGIDIPEIGDGGFPDPGIDDPLSLPETEEATIRPSTENRFSTDQIDESIDDVVSLADDPNVKFSAIYLKLCVVADRLAKPEAASQQDADVRAESLQDYLKSMSESRDQLLTVAQFSDQWLFSGKRNPADTGVVLAGTVTDLEEIPGGHRATIKLIAMDKKGKSVTIVSDKDSSYDKGDNVLMMGTIITDPATELENYDGEESPIVYPSVTTKL